MEKVLQVGVASNGSQTTLKIRIEMVLKTGVTLAVAIKHLVGARTRPLGKDDRPFPPCLPPFSITMFIIGSRKAACNQLKMHQMRCKMARAIRLGYQGLMVGVPSFQIPSERTP